MPSKFYPITLFPTLAEAREWLQQSNKSSPGAICPCCQRFDKVYDRPINISCIKILAGLYRYTLLNGPGYYHYSVFQKSRVGWEFACFFRLLDLIERATNINQKKKTSGMYAITNKGIAFVESKLVIPERLLVYHDELVGTKGEPKFIEQFWPAFDYEVLMNEEVA